MLSRHFLSYTCHLYLSSPIHKVSNSYSNSPTRIKYMFVCPRLAANTAELKQNFDKPTTSWFLSHHLHHCSTRALRGHLLPYYGNQVTFKWWLYNMKPKVDSSALHPNQLQGLGLEVFQQQEDRRWWHVRERLAKIFDSRSDFPYSWLVAMNKRFEQCVTLTWNVTTMQTYGKTSKTSLPAPFQVTDHTMMLRIALKLQYNEIYIWVIHVFPSTSHLRECNVVIIRCGTIREWYVCMMNNKRSWIPNRSLICYLFRAERFLAEAWIL
jgi:hypothetical protein